MLDLRKVIFALLVSSNVFAASGEFRSLTTWAQQKGVTSNFSQLDQSNQSSVSQSLEIVSPTLGKIVTLSANTTVTKTNYDEFRTKDISGNLVPLDKTYDGVDEFVAATVSLAPAPYFVSVSYGKTVNPSPFAQNSVTFDSAYQFLYTTATLGFRFDKSESQQPLSYYGVQNLARPLKLTREKYTLSYEQIWNDNYKSKLELISGARFEDRPRNLGAEFKNFYAFDAKNSVRADLGMLNESKSEALKSDRGYFKMSWGEVGYQRYISYRWQTSLSYGYLQELEEQNPVNNLTTQLANDLYAAKVAYLGTGWKANMQLESAVANTGARQEAVQGGVQWEM